MIVTVDLEGEEIIKNTPDAKGPNQSGEEDEEESDSLTFYVKLYDPSPQGVHISKRNKIQIEIIPEDMDIEENKIEKDKMIEFFVEQNDDTWAYQFKKAIILQPTINENDEVDYVTGGEAFMHFAAIGWKVLFALVPPARIKHGWVSFGVALAFIGVVTAIVGEAANLFGCALGLKQSVTAITFVALGTSLPDTFASMTAAREAEYADAAVGNVTGSNSVNVFLGLGLPWLIGAIYAMDHPDEKTGLKMYRVPAGPLGFSVLVFMICATVCVAILMIRRRVSCFLVHFLGCRRRARRIAGWKVRVMRNVLFFVAFVHCAFDYADKRNYLITTLKLYSD